MSQMLDAILEQVANKSSEHLKKNIRLSQITPIALRTWSETWKVCNQRQPPNGGWDWVYKTKAFKKDNGKYAIDISIWEGNEILCGLALCRVSKKRDNLSIYYIESFPNKTHSLKGHIFDIIELVCLEYAYTQNIAKVRIISPVEGLINFYQSRGYFPQKKTLFGKSYLEKEIS